MEKPVSLTSVSKTKFAIWGQIRGSLWLQIMMPTEGVPLQLFDMLSCFGELGTIDSVDLQLCSFSCSGRVSFSQLHLLPYIDKSAEDMP